MKTKPCYWEEDADGNWITSCGNQATVDGGSPEDNGYKYCCFCGKSLEEVITNGEDIDSDDDDDDIPEEVGF